MRSGFLFSKISVRTGTMSIRGVSYSFILAQDSGSRSLGRPLKPEEAREFMHLARRIAALIALKEAPYGYYAWSL